MISFVDEWLLSLRQTQGLVAFKAMFINYFSTFTLCHLFNFFVMIHITEFVSSIMKEKRSST